MLEIMNNKNYITSILLNIIINVYLATLIIIII